MTHKQKVRIAEFVIFGVLMNMLDNIISVLVLGEVKFHWQMLVVIFLVVLPFSFIGEVIVDHPNFWKKVWPEMKQEATQVEEKIEEIERKIV